MEEKERTNLYFQDVKPEAVPRLIRDIARLGRARMRSCDH